MARSQHRAVTLLAALSAAVILLIATQPALGLPPGTYVLSEDGAWSWFSDQRAFYRDGAVYAGWVTTRGDVEIGSLELLQGDRTIFRLEEEFGPDDHDYPALFQTSDGRYTAFYSGHAVYRTCNLYRTTTRPYDIGAWGERDSTGVNVAGTAGVTYSNPYAIPGEEDRIFLFWRGGDWKPCFAVGRYEPTEVEWDWTLWGRLITVPVGRPYVKYAAGGGKIGVAFTNGHPKEQPCNIYYAAIGKTEDGSYAYFKADGTLIKHVADGALSPTEADLVFDRLADPELYGNNSWVWDLAFDQAGAPVVAFASFLSHAHHQYHWARFDGYEWEDRVVVADAGGSVADTTVGNPQYYYSGGIALDPLDPEIIYVSVENAYGGFDLQRRQMSPLGPWNIQEIAGGTADDNMRPIVPRDRPAGTELVLWMQGHYDYYANWLPGLSEDTPPRALPFPNGEFATTVEIDSTLNYDTDILLWIDPLQTSVAGGDAALRSVLHAARPNPFRLDTLLAYELASPTRVLLGVYDAAGRRVRSLFDGELPAGTHDSVWDGRDDGGNQVASGVYFVRLAAGEITETRRCVLIR